MNTTQTDRIGALIILICSIGYAIGSQSIPIPATLAESAITPRSLPTLLWIAAIGLSLWILVFNKSEDAVSSAASGTPLRWAKFLGIVTLMLAYAFTLRPLGFLLATAAFLLSGFLFLGERNVLRALGVASLVSIAFWALMNYALNVFVAPWPSVAG